MISKLQLILQPGRILIISLDTSSLPQVHFAFAQVQDMVSESCILEKCRNLDNSTWNLRDSLQGTCLLVSQSAHVRALMIKLGLNTCTKYVCTSWSGPVLEGQLLYSCIAICYTRSLQVPQAACSATYWRHVLGACKGAGEVIGTCHAQPLWRQWGVHLEVTLHTCKPTETSRYHQG